MEYFLSLLKIIVLLAVLAGISYFLVKKNKQANRTRKSENDLIKLKDTLLISHQLRAVLLEADGEKVLAIISN
ncbi:flagellar motor switch protein FliN, partial [Escherichia coli]|nr:flagellar motor switch protein FliN [Escherichia coli]